MTSTTFRLVILLSCAHALVHTFEHALPSVELMIGDDFSVGQSVTGSLGTAWRIPFGAAAMLAGWLADRYGAKRLLSIFILGSVATCLLASFTYSLPLLFVVMFAMGSFASIYHPAGLACISHETDVSNRARALGWHGIFGSVGIAAAPLLASLLFLLPAFTWRQYYLALTIPGVLVFLLLYRLLPNHVYHEQPGVKDQSDEESPPGNWSSYFLLVIAGVLFGFIYASFTHFLPRYLDSANLRPAGMTAASTRTLLSGVVLLCGAAGQAFAGRIARPDHLNKFYLVIVLCNVPALLLMAVSQGAMRLVSTCLLAFVHFMNQPIYNSILPQLVPRSRRSLGYGFSNMMCFGLGALGPSFAGRMPNDFINYSVLAGVALLTAGIVFLLGRTMASTTSLTPGS